MSLLEVDKINTYYGEAHALFDVSLHVEQHEVVALLGRNGAGKSTTLNTVMGVLAPKSGTIRFAGAAVQSLPPYEIAQRGVQLVPEERRIFGGLTVEENIVLGEVDRGKAVAARACLRDVPASCRAQAQPRARIVRRRAADAGDCARARARAEDDPA